MKYIEKTCWSFFCTALLLTACRGEDEPRKTGVSAHKQVNEWIDGVMRDHYLWYEEIPEKDELNYEADPTDFYYSLLSDRDGKNWPSGHQYFSTITEKTDSKALPPTDGSATYGIDYMAYQIDNAPSYYLRVNYVLPGSPAAEAGIERGQWIVRQKNSVISKPYSLSAGGPTTLTLARFDATGTLNLIGTASVPAARTVENPPFLLDSVYRINGQTIAYLVYNHFSSGYDYTDKTYDNRMKQIFARFKVAGATECILDLRYNGGGLVSSACLLTSLLAPASALDGVFCIERYNDKQNPREEQLKMDKSAAAANLNLNRLYVITSERSASASELVVNSLRPYMGDSRVVLIGTRSLGKNVGSFTYKPSQPYGYEIAPIAFYVYNKDRKADYADGFVPDISFDEFDSYDSDFQELGCTEENLLKIALAQITGTAYDSGRSLSSGTKARSGWKPVGAMPLPLPFPPGSLLDIKEY